MNRAFRAGETIEDYCRACKTDRLQPSERCETGVSKRGLFGDPILAIRVGTTLLYAASGAVSKMSP